MPTILSPEEPWVDLLFQGEVALDLCSEKKPHVPVCLFRKDMESGREEDNIR